MKVYRHNAPDWHDGKRAPCRVQIKMQDIDFCNLALIESIGTPGPLTPHLPQFVAFPKGPRLEVHVLWFLHARDRFDNV